MPDLREEIARLEAELADLPYSGELLAHKWQKLAELQQERADGLEHAARQTLMDSIIGNTASGPWGCYDCKAKADDYRTLWHEVNCHLYDLQVAIYPVEAHAGEVVLREKRGRKEEGELVR